jgi:hypothetical protein
MKMKQKQKLKSSILNRNLVFLIENLPDSLAAFWMWKQHWELENGYP